jgi:hypothetical protein
MTSFDVRKPRKMDRCILVIINDGLFIGMSHPSAAIVRAKGIGFVVQGKFCSPRVTMELDKNAIKILEENPC